MPPAPPRGAQSSCGRCSACRCAGVQVLYMPLPPRRRHGSPPPTDFGRGVPAITGPRPRAATRNWSAAVPRPHSFQGSFHTPRAHWSSDAVDELFLAGGCSVTPAAGHPGGGAAAKGLCLAVWSAALEGGAQRPHRHQGTAPPILPGGGAPRAAAAHVTQCSRQRLSVRCVGDAVAEILWTVIHRGAEQ